MANPFSAVPTTYRVHCCGPLVVRELRLGRLRVCAALGVDGRIETSCPDCREPLTVQVLDGRPHRDDVLFHCLVPAARWWETSASPEAP